MGTVKYKHLRESWYWSCLYLFSMGLILFSHCVELDHSLWFPLWTHHHLSPSSSHLLCISVFVSSIVEFNLGFGWLLLLLDITMHPAQERVAEGRGGGMGGWRGWGGVAGGGGALYGPNSWFVLICFHKRTSQIGISCTRFFQTIALLGTTSSMEENEAYSSKSSLLGSWGIWPKRLPRF